MRLTLKNTALIKNSAFWSMKQLHFSSTYHISLRHKIWKRQYRHRHNYEDSNNSKQELKSINLYMRTFKNLECSSSCHQPRDALRTSKDYDNWYFMIMIERRCHSSKLRHTFSLVQSRVSQCTIEFDATITSS